MTINEFKLAYPQINPNVNMYTIDLMQNVRVLFYFFFVFFLVFDDYS